ncbi:MAG: hypothetical protein EOP48_14920 [Sphingobacteriales bacterium]|nr:MAG: hypothetical protein EOP48_14920 [Sphingobacteriales bacterium]
MKSITRQQTSYSKRQKRILYFISVALIAGLLFLFYYQKKMTSDTIQTGTRLQVIVTNVDCTNGKTKSRLYFRNDESAVKHVNVNYQDCQSYQPGDTIAVYRNKDKDWYEIDPVSLEKFKPAY